MSLSFRLRVGSEGHPPDFKKAVKASPSWFDFDVHRTRLRTERNHPRAAQLSAPQLAAAM
jgi:hypothetical protein